MITFEPLSVRAPYPNVLQTGRALSVVLEAELGGSAVALDGATWELRSPMGGVVLTKVATVSAGRAVVSVAAMDLAGLAEGHRYTEHWSLTLTGGSTRLVRREAAVAAFDLYPPLMASDLAKGAYPDLEQQLSAYGTDGQGFLDEAWAEIVEQLFEHEDIPTVIVSSSALRKPLKELALHFACRFLYRAQNGANKWKELADEHFEAWLRAWSAKTYLVDRDSDGAPDGDTRESGTGIVHLNAGGAPLRRRRSRVFG